MGVRRTKQCSIVLYFVYSMIRWCWPTICRQPADRLHRFVPPLAHFQPHQFSTRLKPEHQFATILMTRMRSMSSMNWKRLWMFSAMVRSQRKHKMRLEMITNSACGSIFLANFNFNWKVIDVITIDDSSEDEAIRMLPIQKRRESLNYRPLRTQVNLSRHSKHKKRKLMLVINFRQKANGVRINLRRDIRDHRIAIGDSERMSLDDTGGENNAFSYSCMQPSTQCSTQ